MGFPSVRMWEYRFGAVRVSGVTTAVWRGALLQMSVEVPGTGWVTARALFRQVMKASEGRSERMRLPLRMPLED